MSDRQSFQRIFLIVLDSVGIGALPDAVRFGDEGAHTLGHIAEHVNGLDMPQCQRLGLGNIERIRGIEPVRTPAAMYGKMSEASAGKDTLTGHWELMGLRMDVPFRTFTETGFPAELMHLLEQRTGRNIIGNKAASGTEIIKELGERHIQTGDLIVYTSADSVLQIAAHEEIISVPELYDICTHARELTKDEPYMLGRIIARPFTGEPGRFVRTSNRKDFALKPFGKTVLNHVQDGGYTCMAIGKIEDIFDGEGVTRAIKTTSNMDGVDRLLQEMAEDFKGLVFVNLIDFDALYGHRRDPAGYAEALQAFDARLPEVLSRLHTHDLLIITADHGNDPLHHGTDHTREYVPLLAYSPALQKGADLGIRQTFADVGATIADNFNVQLPEHGQSFLGVINLMR